jgi:thiamine pyrophosphate-dependent acetolactate synthase large subunit-like protein
VTVAQASSGGPSRTTAAAVLDVLAGAGVTTTFGLPGVHNLAFWAAQAPGRPRIVGVRHEQTAGYAADGLARAGGGLGVALTTTGPGAANAVAAFGEAAASRSPVLLLASDVSTRLRRAGAVRGLLHESADQAALFAPLAKAVYRPESSLAAVEATARAASTALTHPQGPVYVGIPVDILEDTLPATSSLPGVRGPDPPGPTPGAVDAALSLLAHARRPLLWVGGGAVASGAAESVTELAWRLGAPVVTTYAARGLLAGGHPLLVDAPPHEPEVAELVGSADLLVALGSAFDGMSTRNWTMPVPPRLLAVNVDEGAAAAYPADVFVAADVRATCDALALRLRQREPWADSVFRIGPSLRHRLAADPQTTQAAALLDSVEQAWPVEGVVVCDMAVAGYWVGGYATMTRPRRLQYPVGWGTLGYALPATVGAAQAAAPVLAVCGDGGAAMAVGELATLVQEQLPVTVLVVDDGGYGMLRYDQRRSGQAERGVDLAGPDWLALASAYGVAAEAASDAGPALAGALSRAAAATGPRLVVLKAALVPPRTTSPRWAD